MIAVLDPLLRLLRSHERPDPGRYRLTRLTFRSYADAWWWLSRQPGVTWESASARNRALESWIALRRRHHVAWLERGGAS
jgi:hypothetical protein